MNCIHFQHTKSASFYQVCKLRLGILLSGLCIEIIPNYSHISTSFEWLPSCIPSYWMPKSRRQGITASQSHQSRDDEEGNRNPSMDNEEMGKAPMLDLSIDNGTVTVPLPRPLMVGWVATAAEPPPRLREQAVSTEPTPWPRERAVSTEPLPQPRQRAVGAEKPTRPRVWAGVATATSKDDGVEPFFFLAAADVDISGKPKLETRVRDWDEFGGSEDARIYEGGDGFGTKKKSRARQIDCCCVLASARVGSEHVSPLGDEPVQRSHCRLFRIGAQDRTIVSQRNFAPISRLCWGFFYKRNITETKKNNRCTCS